MRHIPISVVVVTALIFSGELAYAKAVKITGTHSASEIKRACDQEERSRKTQAATDAAQIATAAPAQIVPSDAPAMVSVPAKCLSAGVLGAT